MAPNFKRLSGNMWMPIKCVNKQPECVFQCSDSYCEGSIFLQGKQILSFSGFVNFYFSFFPSFFFPLSFSLLSTYSFVHSINILYFLLESRKCLTGFINLGLTIMRTTYVKILPMAFSAMTFFWTLENSS